MKMFNLNLVKNVLNIVKLVQMVLDNVINVFLVK